MSIGLAKFVSDSPNQVDTSVTPLPVSVTSSAAKQYSTSTTPSIATANADVGTLASGEKLVIQNLDTDALTVRYGTGASSTVFTFLLKGGTAADDGNGGSCVIDDWIGVVSVAAQTGSPRFIVSKLS